MKNYSGYIKTVRLLWNHHPLRLVRIIFLTLLIGVSSGFSVLLLVPMLQLLGPAAVQPGRIELFFRDSARLTGMPLTVGTILAVWIILFVSVALLQYCKSIADARYQQGFIYGVRQRLFRKVILADWTVINGRSKTGQMQILTREIPNMGVYYVYFLRLLSEAVMIICYLVYAFIVSPLFSGLILIAGFIIFMLLRTFLYKALDLGESYVESYGRLYKYIDDFWQTVKIAKVQRSEKFYYDKFDEASSSLLKLEYKMERNRSLPQLIYRICGVAILAITVFAAYKTGNSGLASLFILIILFSRIFPQFVAVNSDIGMLFSNLASVEMILQLDAELPENDFRAKTDLHAVKPENRIELENISFTWPDGETLFSSFSETVPAGTLTGILGESGRGKTTLIDIIAGLQKPDSGAVLIDGRELSGQFMEDWKSGLGYLPQDTFFIDGTLRENLTWDSRINGDDSLIIEILRKVKAEYLLKRFEKGLDSHIVNYQYSFSGGERQKLALARVLLRNPAVLILDEATSSLDTENETQIMEVLDKLKSSVTVIFVTHRSYLSKWFDKTITV
jgi:ATP-binding cassette, subfamily C, bacterial